VYTLSSAAFIYLFFNWGFTWFVLFCFVFFWFRLQFFSVFKFKKKQNFSAFT